VLKIEQIRKEIESRFGFFPPFFSPALDSPQVLENLWQQTVSAYLESPFSPLFKEKLNALLSRYCAVPYCMVCHSSALRPLGVSASTVLALLEMPVPILEKLPLDRLPVPSPAEAAAPIPGSPLEEVLLSCATLVFLERQDAGTCQAELRRLLGPDLYPHLIAYLGYIKTCHTWMEAHPDISYEADKRTQEFLGPLLAEEPALADFFAHYGERVAQRRLDHAVEEARSEERQQANVALQESEDKFRLLVDGARDYAMILLDEAGRISHWNLGAQRILGYEEAEVLGHSAECIFTPEDQAAGVPARELETARALGKALDIRWHQRKDGSRFWADGVMECLRNEAGQVRGFAKVLRDATERKATEDALWAANLRTTNILESITDAFYTLDRAWQFTYVNTQAERLLRRRWDELLGRRVWDEFPEAVGSEFDRQYRRAASERMAVTFEAFYPPLDTWFEVRTYPSTEGVSVYFHDISARKSAEAARDEAETNLRESERRFRQMADAMPQITWTARADGNLDYFNQRTYEYTGMTLEELRDSGWGNALHPDEKQFAYDVYDQAIQSGTIYEIEYRIRRADGAFRWHLGRSLPVRGPLGEILYWVGTATDIEDRRQIETEREHLLLEAQARAERESLLNRIGAAIRDSNDQNIIQARAAAALGEALNADRCFFVAYEEARDLSMISQEWYREGLPPLTGPSPLSEFPASLDLLQVRRPLVVEDRLSDLRFVALAPAMARLQLRASIGVPLFDGSRLVALVGVAMADTARAWTADEIILVETVAAQVRTAVEAARLRLREHNIATQLQEALQPSLPSDVPGLKLNKYYEVALAEAEVGGDFYDVFPLGKKCTILVVGDLSGKGLAAAAQVATVRNMLRATLYLGGTLAAALTDLNTILADNDLLTGFATLFVGAFDPETGRLVYVNCGQEPGLVRRARTGLVEELPPTGPVMGTFAGVVFTEETVKLASGDALALFTDGFTEAGPNRADMLGIEGVAALLAAPLPKGAETAAQQAEELSLRLIAGVDQYAQAGVRDDVYLLLAVVE
jgi:PAS domain S-box-containing protein